LRQLGQYQKLAQAQNQTTITKFSFAKYLKHTVEKWNYTGIAARKNWLIFKGYQEPDEDKTGTQSIMLATFVAVIFACQVPSVLGTVPF
jgi:hypothetical protein